MRHPALDTISVLLHVIKMVTTIGLRPLAMYVSLLAFGASSICTDPHQLDSRNLHRKTFCINVSQGAWPRVYHNYVTMWLLTCAHVNVKLSPHC